MSLVLPVQLVSIVVEPETEDRYARLWALDNYGRLWRRVLDEVSEWQLEAMPVSPSPAASEPEGA